MSYSSKICFNLAHPSTIKSCIIQFNPYKIATRWSLTCNIQWRTQGAGPFEVKFPEEKYGLEKTWVMTLIKSPLRASPFKNFCVRYWSQRSKSMKENDDHEEDEDYKIYFFVPSVFFVHLWTLRIQLFIYYFNFLHASNWIKLK